MIILHSFMETNLWMQYSIIVVSSVPQLWEMLLSKNLVKLPDSLLRFLFLILMWWLIFLQMREKFVFVPNDPRSSSRLNVEFRLIKGTCLFTNYSNLMQCFWWNLNIIKRSNQNFTQYTILQQNRTPTTIPKLVTQQKIEPISYTTTCCIINNSRSKPFN